MLPAIDVSVERQQELYQSFIFGTDKYNHMIQCQRTTLALDAISVIGGVGLKDLGLGPSPYNGDLSRYRIHITNIRRSSGGPILIMEIPI